MHDDLLSQVAVEVVTLGALQPIAKPYALLAGQEGLLRGGGGIDDLEVGDEFCHISGGDGNGGVGWVGRGCGQTWIEQLQANNFFISTPSYMYVNFLN